MIKVPGCRLLLKPLKFDEQDAIVRSAKAAGIAIPELTSRREQANVEKGIVLFIGSKCSPDYIDGVEVGDTIGFAKFGGKFVYDTNKDDPFLIINDEDVICIYKD